MNGGIPHIIRGGFKEKFLSLSPYGPAVTDVAKKDGDAAKAKLIDGTLVIYTGEIKDNTGKMIVAPRKALPQKDLELEKMNWLVEGVNGSIS